MIYYGFLILHHFDCTENLHLNFICSIFILEQYFEQYFFLLQSSFIRYTGRQGIWKVHMCVRMCIKPAMTCIGNVTISIAFCLSYLHTWSLSFQTWTVLSSYPLHLYNPEFHKLQARYGEFTCVRKCIKPTAMTCICNVNFQSFFLPLLSTHMVSELPSPQSRVS